jgi:hypothetical protein
MPPDGSLMYPLCTRAKRNRDRSRPRRLPPSDSPGRDMPRPYSVFVFYSPICVVQDQPTSTCSIATTPRYS